MNLEIGRKELQKQPRYYLEIFSFFNINQSYRQVLSNYPSKNSFGNDNGLGCQKIYHKKSYQDSSLILPKVLHPKVMWFIFNFDLKVHSTRLSWDFNDYFSLRTTQCNTEIIVKNLQGNGRRPANCFFDKWIQSFSRFSVVEYCKALSS